jgi:hypothetical protein
MAIENFSVPLKCLFCGSALEAKSDAEFQSGDLIPCTHCGEGNDYESVLEVATEEAMARTKEAVEAELASLFKR